MKNIRPLCTGLKCIKKEQCARFKTLPAFGESQFSYPGTSGKVSADTSCYIKSKNDTIE